VDKRKPGQPQRLSTALIALLIGGVLLIAAAVVFFAFGSGGNGGGAPRLVVDQNKIDYGYVQFGKDKAFSIKVTNAGDGVLRFQEKPVVEVLEGC
jgi:hypothetical protein